MEECIKKLNKIVAILTQAPVMAALLLVCIFLFFANPNKLFPFVVSLFSLSIVPAVVIPLWGRIKGTDYEITNRKDRFVPYVLMLIVYAICMSILFFIGESSVYFFVSVCYLIGTLVIFIVNNYTKISVHASGSAMFSSIFICVFGIVGIITIIIIPIVMWSRYYSKKHTVKQLLLGAFIGFSIPILLFVLFSIV